MDSNPLYDDCAAIIIHQHMQVLQVDVAFQQNYIFVTASSEFSSKFLLHFGVFSAKVLTAQYLRV